jgi:hypothetical protein
LKIAIVAALAALPIALGALPAAAQSANDQVFAAIRQTCLATSAAPAAATTAADAHGWRGGTYTRPPLDKFSVDAKVSRSAHIAGSDLELFAWQGKNPGGITASECAVKVSKTKFAALRAAAAAMTGFEAQESAAATATFRYTGPADAPKPLDKAQFEDAAANGGIEMLTVSQQGSDVIVALLVLHK